MSTWTIEELALAYELRQEGCSWKRITQGIGGDWKLLKDRIRNLEAGGIIDPRTKVPDQVLALAHEMRTRSRLSWRAIGRHLGFSADSLRSAYSRRVTRSASDLR